MSESNSARATGNQSQWMEMRRIGDAQQPTPDSPHTDPPQAEPQREKVSCYRRCCCPKWKGMSWLAGFLILAFVASVAGYVFWPYGMCRSNANNTNLVLEELAAYYKKTLDQTIQPCDNFYKFTCSNLMSEYKNENKSRFDTVKMMEKNARLSLDDLLTKPLNASDSPPLRQMKTFHQACINTTKVDAEGIEPMLALLKEIGGWPLLLTGWNDTQRWEEIIATINRAGIATLFPYDLKPSSALMLSPVANHERPRVLPDESRTVEYVKRVATLLNATNDELDDDIKDCIDFETELYEIANSVEKVFVMRTLANLMLEYPGVAWESFLRNVFVSTGIEVSNYGWVYFTHSGYTSKISNLLSKTSVKVIRNYIVWQQIEQAIPVMPEKFREAKNIFDQRPVGQSRNRDCVEILVVKAKVPIGYLYIKNFLDGPAKNKSQGILESVESQAYRYLNNLTWMDNETNTKIIETFRKSTITLPLANDSTNLMEELEFQSNDTTFANYRRLLGFHHDSKYRQSKMSLEEYQRRVPFKYATKADAYYFIHWNKIFILAAMVQRPVFSVEQPMYLNYGGIGFVLAHEITHALRILSVCANSTCPSYEAFRNRTGCMEKKYGGYNLEQLDEKVNGTKTAEENIGDFIGLKLAYRAYEEYVKGSNESSLPGFDYTPRQWFWINAATFFCSSATDAGLRNIIATEVHSPAEARVNVAFANIEQFSIDFACPSTTYMNPADRCKF